MKTSGFKDYRLKENDDYYKDEVNALKVFNEDHIEYVDLIVFGQKGGSFMKPNNNLSEREEKIVLGVIQWLGTPVGKSFINKVFNTELF